MIIRHKLEKLENTSEQYKNNQLILAQLLNDCYSKAHKILDLYWRQSDLVAWAKSDDQTAQKGKHDANYIMRNVFMRMTNISDWLVPYCR